MTVAELAGLLDATDIDPAARVYVLVDGKFRPVISASWVPLDEATRTIGSPFSPDTNDVAIIKIE